jgi:hypothetical protein
MLIFKRIKQLMKYFIIIASFFITHVCYSQNFINRAGAANTVIDQRLGAAQNFFLPRLNDTTLSGGLDTIGNLIYDRLRGKIAIRDTVLTGGHKFTFLFKQDDTISTLATQYDLTLLTADNGLTKTGSNTQLGGALIQNTTIDAGSLYNLAITSSGSGTPFRVTNTGSGNGVFINTFSGTGSALSAQSNNANVISAFAFGTGYGASLVSTSNIGMYASTTSGPAGVAVDVNPSSTNTSQTILQLKRYTSGTAANNIAGRIEFITEPSSGTVDVTSGYVESGWEDATFATRKSFMALYTTFNGSTTRKANLSSSGQWTWDGYPALTAQVDTTTYKPVAIDGSGNVVKMSGWPGSGGTFATNNIGTGFAWVATPSGDIKRVANGYGVIWDSTGTANSLTAKADTSTLKAVYLPIHLNASKTIDQNAFNIYFTGGGEVKSDSFRITTSATFGSPTALLGVGDSYMQGFRPCVPDTIFFDRLTDIYNLTPLNYGVSSTGIWRADSIHNYRVNPGHSNLSFVWAGFNDVRRGGITNDTTYRKIITGLKSIIANQFLKSYVAGGSSGTGITRYGTWTTTYICAAVGGKSANNGAYTNTNNDSIVYVFPSSDTTVTIGTINGDGHAAGYNMGTFDIYIDGTLWGSFNGLNADGISDGFNDNARSPNSFIITGLSNAVHTIKIVNTSTDYLVVDYFGHLIGASMARPLLIAHAPYNNITGFAVSPNKGSVAAMDKLNDQIDSMVAVTAVGWPIFVVQTNNCLDTLTGICTDNIHPNNTGDIQITNCVLAELPVANTDVQDGTLAFTGTYFKGAANGVTHLIPWLDETLQQSDTSLFIRNQTAFDQNGAFRITGASLLKNKLTVGSASLSDGSDQLDVLTTAGHMRVLGFASQHYWQSIDNTNTTGVPFNFGAGTINFGVISGGGTTNYATFNNAAANKFTITGNALINSTVRIGSNISPLDAPVTIGTLSTTKGYLSLKKTDAITDQKIWDKVIENDSTFTFRTVDDVSITPDSIYYVTRSGIRPNRFIIPKATLNLGYLNMQGNGLGAYFNRIIGANKDSIILRSTTATRQMMVMDTANGRFERMDIPSGATTIYNGDATLLADRNIASGGFTLRLTGANNSDTLMSIINTGTSSTALFANGTLFGIDAQSANVGLRAFGTSIGMTAEGATNEGAIIKSDAVRGATIQSVPATTNTVQEVIRLERGSTGGPGGNGIGGSADFYNKLSDNSSNVSNQIISKWTNATVGSRTSQFSITGVNSTTTGTVLTIDGDGTLTTAGKRIVAPVTSSAGTLTIGNAEFYCFNGTTTTWTLPAVTGTAGTIYYLKNIGSGTITLNADSGSNEIYSTSAVNTLAITAGTSVILISNGTFFTTNN